MKMVAIIEATGGKVVASVPVKIATSDRDYFDEAWQLAVDEGLVDASRRADYTFVLA